jgi:hypothetical protein
VCPVSATARDPVRVIQEQLDEWEVPFVELDVFGTREASRIVEIVEAFAREQLGSGVDGYLHYGSSVGSTHCVELLDGRRVVIKVRPTAADAPVPIDREDLEQIMAVQRHLATHGYPCPEPLLGPVPLGRGLATVETYLDRGIHRDAHDPHVRDLVAVGLREQIGRLSPLVATVRPKHFEVPRDRLFPRPHGRLFVPSEADTGWVRELAGRARAIAESVPSPPELGHCDFRVEHIRFEGDAIVATYDWDSVALRPELEIVGTNAHGHTADWSQEAIRRVPTLEGMLGFLAAYDRARPVPFTREQHRGARAWAAYWIAYGAWISIAPGDTDWPEDSWPALLRDAGERLLA